MTDKERIFEIAKAMGIENNWAIKTNQGGRIYNKAKTLWKEAKRTKGNKTNTEVLKALLDDINGKYAETLRICGNIAKHIKK